MNNLFESSSLRAASISGVPPTEVEKARAALLALPLKKNPLKKGEESTFGEPASTMKPQKRLRGELAPEELNSLRSRAAEVTAKQAGLSTTTQKEKLGKKRRRLDRGQGPSRMVEQTRVDSAEGLQQVAPPPQQLVVVTLDEASPPRKVEGGQGAGPVNAETQAEGSRVPTRTPSKEPAEASEAAGEEAILL